MESSILMENSTRMNEALAIKNQYREKEIIRQIAYLLAQEKLITPEEHLRFLALLKEES